MLLVLVILLKTTFAFTGDWQTSIKTTVYGSGDGGNCYADTVVTSSFPYGYIVAVGSSLWDNGNGCGACYECVDTTTGNSKILQVVDQCPECSVTHFDLSTLAWNYLTNNRAQGIGEIKYRRVSCPYSGKNINIVIKGGSSQWHLEFYIRQINNYGTISKAEVQAYGGSWITCPHVSGQGFFQCASINLGTNAVRFRLTDSNSVTITSAGSYPDTSFGGIITGGNSYSGSVDFGTNFPTTGTGSTPVTAPTPTPQPVTSPTPKPVTAPVATPVANPVANPVGSSTPINLQIKSGSNKWWFGLVLINTNCVTIKSVAIKESGSSTWVTSTKEWDYYPFQNDNGWTTPISVRIISSDGATKTSTNIITAINENRVYTTSNTFGCCTNCLTDNNNSAGKMAAFNDFKNYTAGNWVLFICLIIGIILLIGTAIFCTVKAVKKRKAVDSEYLVMKNEQTDYEPPNNGL